MVVAIAVVAAGLFLRIYYVAGAAGRTALELELAKALLTFVLIGVAAMFVKAGLDENVAAKARALIAAEQAEAKRKADHALRVKSLATVTTSYWNIKKALKIVEANRSALSYGKQVQIILDHRLELQQLDNEIMAGTLALSQTKEICEALHAMDKRLEAIIDEWRDKYLGLAQLQIEDEKVPPKQKKVPAEIDALPAFRAIREQEFQAIHGPFEIAANLIRNQVFPERQPMAPGRTDTAGDADGRR